MQSQDRFDAAHELIALPRIERVGMRRSELAGVVVEGRDQGTVVFPNAECKFFLVADATERARRRFRELENSPTGRSVGFSELLQQIQQRDQRDEERSDSPLKPADDALLIDTTSSDAANEAVSLNHAWSGG